MNEPPPAPLPFTVKPRPGEHYTTYLHRLAQANHLRPSLLRAYVNAHAHAAEAFRLERLAALSGRTPQALRHTLTGVPALKSPPPPGAPPSRFKRYYPKRKIPRTPEDRLTRDLEQAAEEMRYLDQLALYDQIRADRQSAGMTITKLARLYMIGEGHVRAILRGLPPRPPGQARPPKPAPTLEPVKTLIHQMWREGLAADQIWSELVDRHGAAISKNTLKAYLRALRHEAAPDP